MTPFITGRGPTLWWIISGLDNSLFYLQGGPPADRYKWSPYKWPKRNGCYSWGYNRMPSSLNCLLLFGRNFRWKGRESWRFLNTSDLKKTELLNGGWAIHQQKHMFIFPEIKTQGEIWFLSNHQVVMEAYILLNHSVSAANSCGFCLFQFLPCFRIPFWGNKT